MGDKTILIFLSALLTGLSFHPSASSGLLFFSLVPLLIDLYRSAYNKKILFKKGFFFGFVFMGVYHAWMFSLTAWAPLVWILLLWGLFMAYLSLFYGLLFVILGRFKQSFWSLLIFPSAWICMEWLRALGPIGNPGGSIGYGLIQFLPLVQLASITGVYGLSFITVLINHSLYFSLQGYFLAPHMKPGIKRPYAFILAPILLLISLWAFGWTRMTTLDSISLTPSLHVAVIQGNHRQALKLDQVSHSSIRQDYLTLIDQLDSPSLIILPETITASLNLRYPSFTRDLRSLLRKGQHRLILGSPIKEQGAYYNAAIGMTPESSSSIYRKIKLMPFGEYWPLKPLLRLLPDGFWNTSSDYSSGTSFNPITLGSFDVGTAICLESIYPWHFRYLVNKGCSLFVVLANNAWFFDSTAAYKHFQMSHLRAIEFSRYLIQSSNTGISAIISPSGSYHLLPTNQKEILHGAITLSQSKTFYALFGDFMVYISFLFLFFFSLYSLKK